VRNAKLLLSFVAYCLANPDQRFWQALRNWAGVGFVFVSDSPAYEKPKLVDTFASEYRDPIMRKD
jgi:hypothetical protein